MNSVQFRNICAEFESEFTVANQIKDGGGRTKKLNVHIYYVYYEKQEEKATTKQKQMIVVKHLFAMTCVCVCLYTQESMRVNVEWCECVWVNQLWIYTVSCESQNK